MAICKWCGKEFTPSHPNQKICKDVHYNPCPVCGKPVVRKGYYIACCSKECTTKLRKHTCNEKYGGDAPACSVEIQNKMKQTCLQNHRVEYPSQDSIIRQEQVETYLSHYGKDENPEGKAELDERRKFTCLKRYGVEFVTQSEEFKQASKESCLERYGTEYAMQYPEIQKRMENSVYVHYGVKNAAQSSEVQKKLVETNLKKYGTISPFGSSEIREKISATMQERYGVPWYCMTDECKFLNGRTISKLNFKFAEFLESNGIEYEMEFRIENRCYDFKVDNILIELNPFITHTTLLNIYDTTLPGKPVDYHLKKTELAENYGYRCIHVWDWDDWNKILNQLLPKTKIYARQCQIREVSKSDSDLFLEEHHMQGSCKGQSIRYGLYYNNTLVEIMTFGKPRYNKNYEWELLRLCSKSGISVTGGSEKLFKHFIDTVDPSSVVSYCDNSKFTGDVYQRIGMEYSHSSQCNKIWCNGKNKITNNLLLQRGYDQLFGTSYGKGTDNEQLMVQQGYYPLYDCGQSVYKYIRR